MESSAELQLDGHDWTGGREGDNAQTVRDGCSCLIIMAGGEERN